MVHPRERDVRGELVVFGFEPECCQALLDVFVESRESVTARPDTEPDDTDVVETREDAQAAELGLERGEATVGDGPPEGVGDCRHPLGVGVTEKFQRHVGLCRVGHSQTARVGEQRLDGGDVVGQFTEVDRDEQSHTGLL